MFREYIDHGWKICRIESGSKGPRYKGWNLPENALTSAEGVEAAGLMHAYSGTAALDIDDLAKANIYLQEHGIELTDLLMAPDAVQISSGRPNRGKLLYAMSESLPSKSFAEGAFELRCGTNGGKSAQDVLPPSPHPSGTAYKWVGNWKMLPPIPEMLLHLWRRRDSMDTVCTGVDTSPNESSSQASLAEIRDLLSRRDPSCGYDEWLRVGMAIHHETEGSDDGFAEWDQWSAKSDKYPGIADLRSHWVSFGRTDNPVTLNSLRKTDVAAVEEFDSVDESADIFGTSGMEKSASQEPAFQFLSLPDLFARPEPDWLIRGVLPQRGLGSFWGQPGGGKTFLAVDIALSIALGQDWRGIPINAGGVLYIAAEDDTGVQVRLASSLARRGRQDAPIRVLPVAPVFTSAKQADALLRTIQAEGKQALVVVDTLAAVTPGSDENAAKDMGKLIQFCHKIHRVTGALVLLIHHEGKTSGKGPRGWSGLHGAFDVEWEVTDESSHREMRVSKMKNAPTGNSYVFHLAPAGKSCIVEWV